MASATRHDLNGFDGFVGGSAFGSNVLLQSREVFAALLCQGNCAFKRGETEGAGIFFAKPLRLSGGLQRAKQVKRRRRGRCR